MEIEIDGFGNKLLNEEELEKEEEERIKKLIVETSYVELNEFDSKENDYLLFSNFGNASGYLRVALYEELRKDPKAFKGKFMQEGKPNNKLVAEVFQFKHNNEYSIVVLPKGDFNKQNYTYISDFIINKNSGNNKLTVKRIVALNSTYYNDLVKQNINEDFRNNLYCVKNELQKQSNQMIKAKDLPVFNSIGGFSAYLMIKSEALKIPCVYYLAAHTEYEVCLTNLRIFDACAVTYPFFRKKLSEENLKNITIGVPTLLKEYNSYKNSIYS